MRLLLIGDENTQSFDRPDLRLHSDWSVLHSSSLAVAGKPPPDLVIAFQDRPKQFTQQEVLRCLAAAPLLRMVLVLGPWCGGDLRTPGRLAGVHVLHFGKAELCLAGLVEEFRLGKGILAGPLTAIDGYPEFRARGDRSDKTLRVGICLNGRLASGAAACLELLGHTPVVQSECRCDAGSLDLVLVDGDNENARHTDYGNARVLRLCGFVRQMERPTLSKNCYLSDLEAAIDRIMAEPSGAATTREPLTSRSHTSR